MSDSSIQRAASSMIALVTRRSKLGVFDSPEEALAYLAREHAQAVAQA